MKLAKEIAKNIRAFYFGKNWTASFLKEHLEDVTWEQALTKVKDLNTIAILAYHIHYYITSNIRVLTGGSLDAKDSESFSHPPINCQEDWDQMLELIWTEGEQFAQLVESLQDDQLDEFFELEKYGTYYANFQGILEHSYYHLGQIVILKKLL